MTKIYTKTGDNGNTGTFKGRISKSDELAEALGSVDELNSWIGMCRNECVLYTDQCKDIEQVLHKIQNNLLIIGSGMAGSGLKLKVIEVTRLEKLIDKLTKDLPKLANFIFPTGFGPAAMLQVSRTIARRAERRIVAANITDKNVLKYINRLSDALFTMARWVNWRLGGKEEVWKNN